MLSTLLFMAATYAVQAEADYSGAWRPQFHFTPEKNWMNDPNGLVWYDGEYHLFYQYNPMDKVWGHMSWGHGVSRDLVHWEHLPIALQEETEWMMFSGSAVVDTNNVTGFFSGPDSQTSGCLVCFYTAHKQGRQTQNLAYSNDRGRTWTKYSGNPVIDIGYADFRDPKVIWHEQSKKWVMAVALSTEKQVRFYGSKDLKQWSHLSDFGPEGSCAGPWECPDLMRFPDEQWLLQVCVGHGRESGGSGVQYFMGRFDGTKFTNDNSTSTVFWMDHGPDFYASQSWSDIPERDGRRISIAWMTNLEYAGNLPTDPWRGNQSVPRVLELKQAAGKYRLIQNPVEELKLLRGQHTRFQDQTLSAANSLLTDKNVSGDLLEVLAEFELGTTEEAGIKLRKGADEETVVGYDALRQQMFVDRKHSGKSDFHERFATRHSAAMAPDNGKVRLHLFVDRSSVEVFGNGGETVISALVFPSPESSAIQCYQTGNNARLASMDVWNLKSIWKDE
ncbi:MAG: glycoside hydrolase family 32 protein [Candidatus Sumerlaeaceae bacterium]